MIYATVALQTFPSAARTVQTAIWRQALSTWGVSWLRSTKNGSVQLIINAMVRMRQSFCNYFSPSQGVLPEPDVVGKRAL